jgi:predicted permease
LLFACGVALVSALLVALVPALRSTHLDVARDLSAGARQHSAGTARFEAWIVSGQVGFASLLLVAAGLFAGTVYRLLRVDPGFSTQGVLMMPTDMHLRPEKGEQLNAFYERLLERLRNSPGVESASAATMPMLGGWSASAYYASVLPDGTVRADNSLFFNSVGSNYFTTTGTRILAGRDFTLFDRDIHHRTCILNRSAAEYFFPQGNAVGASVRDYSQRRLGDPCQIVGVVEDIKFTSLRADMPRTIYWTFMEDARPGQRDSLFVVVRTENPNAASTSMRQIMGEMAPQSPLLEPIAMDEQLRESIGRERAMATLAAAFGALALLLTAVGLYGTLSYQVSRRTREIAIRMAVGADQARVLRMIIRRAVLLTAAGLVAGTAASLLSMRFIRSLLFGVKPTDPAPLAFAAAVLVVIAMVAGYLPARRAAKVDPMEALRGWRRAPRRIEEIEESHHVAGSGVAFGQVW